jgi:urea transport system substrate-binding protein
MIRWLVAIFSLAVAGTLLGLLLRAGISWWAEPPLSVGLLHSQTGSQEVSEQPMVDAEILALEEINARGGLLGRPVKWVVADGRSDWRTFAQEAERLIEQAKVEVLFGCWTSASRKSVRPIVERHNHLLFYPNAYEGLEQSPNIIYTGAAPNQHIIPTIKWTYDHLKARKYFLAASDHIWPRCVNAIVGDCVHSLGAKVVGEEYLLVGSLEVDELISKIRRLAPDVVISTLAPETNTPFYQKLKAGDLGPERLPVVAFGVSERELQRLPVGDMVGDYSSWSYFQSIDRPENREFVQKFRTRYGSDRVVSDATATAYASVWLWAQAVEEGETSDVATVRRQVAHQSLNAPEGVISIDAETQHAWRSVSIGRVRPDGQFDIVWTSAAPVRPIPFPTSRTRGEWEAFLNGLVQRWDGNWVNPAREKGAISALSR